MVNFLFNMKQSYSKEPLLWLICGLIISIFFPVRHVFFSDTAYITGAYSDFTSFSIYLTDFLVFAIFYYFFRKINNFEANFVNKLLILYIFWLILGVLLNSSSYFQLSLYLLIRVSVLAGLFLILGLHYKREYNKIIFSIFVYLSAIQSLIATFQFLIQKSLGLKIIGEQVLAQNILGVAKIVQNGEKYIRGYGTFPHPNLLAAFLVIGIILNIYLLITEPNNAKKRIILYIFLFTNIFGLFITFSRGGLICLIFVLLATMVRCLANMALNKRLFKVFVFAALSIMVSGAILWQFLVPRGTFSDSATNERIFYNKTGLNMAKNRILTGVGLGQSALHMEHYSNTKLEPWEKQPIHNYFLLTAGETGLPGLILFGLFFFFIGYKLIKIRELNVPWETSNLMFFLLIIYLCLLLLMQFDHYFFTIEQTQVLFWLILGIIFANLNIFYRTSE